MLGLDFDIVTSNAEEKIDAGSPPAEMVMQLARAKGEGITGDVVISADTIVCLDGKILCKPRSREEAADMLRALSGRTHEVYTGICVNGRTDYEKSEVTFAEMSEREIEAYIETGEPMDKAGAYGIQGMGACFVKEIKGDFFNVMGLPVHKLYCILKEEGLELI